MTGLILFETTPLDLKATSFNGYQGNQIGTDQCTTLLQCFIAYTYRGLGALPLNVRVPHGPPRLPGIPIALH